MADWKPQLKDGSEWIDHEDCIVGDEQGLRNLISACQAAIENGEHYGDGLGDYVGVKKLDACWFKDPSDSPRTRCANYGLAVFLVTIAGLLLIGLATVFSWLL